MTQYFMLLKRGQTFYASLVFPDLPLNSKTLLDLLNKAEMKRNPVVVIFYPFCIRSQQLPGEPLYFICFWKETQNIRARDLFPEAQWSSDCWSDI